MSGDREFSLESDRYAVGINGYQGEVRSVTLYEVMSQSIDCCHITHPSKLVDTSLVC